MSLAYGSATHVAGALGLPWYRGRVLTGAGCGSCDVVVVGTGAGAVADCVVSLGWVTEASVVVVLAVGLMVALGDDTTVDVGELATLVVTSVTAAPAGTTT